MSGPSRVHPVKGKNSVIPWGSEQEIHTWTTYRISLRATRKLQTLKKKLGFKSYEGVILYLTNIAEREGLIPVASFEKLENDTRPCVITGEPGSGKTFFIKSILKKWDQDTSILLIDVADEYQMLEKLDLGQVFSIRWEQRGQRYRFVPNPNLEISKAEAGAIFSHLNLVKQSNALKHWIIVVEEAHRFQEDKNFNSLVVEARKFTKKLILVTADWRPWDGRAIIYKPPPLDTLLKLS
ncbi:MAG: DEAD/DEAH box helicase family protein [Nitrososphaeria archaeon]|nr:DEAD/DEAH box helicase family protein [Nitrososphaeria archaeon]